MLESFFYLLLLFAMIFAFGTMAYAGIRAAPWVPTRKKDLERLINLAEIKEGETIYELGCGDGRILAEIAKRYRVQAIGFEISALMYLASKIRILLLNNLFVHKLKGSVKIVYHDFFNHDLSKADVIICFLVPRAMIKLEEKLKKENKKNLRIISYIFPLKTALTEKVSKPDKKSNSIYRQRLI